MRLPVVAPETVSYTHLDVYKRQDIMREVLSCFERMGAVVRSYENTIELWAAKRLKSPGIIVTQPYPGFPTDCQPQLMSLCAKARGLTTVREEIFESRFTHKNDLIKMGADIETCGKNAIITVSYTHLCTAEWTA